MKEKGRDVKVGIEDAHIFDLMEDISKKGWMNGEEYSICHDVCTRQQSPFHQSQAVCQVSK